MEKVVKIVSKIAYQILVAVCLIVAAVIIFQKISDSNRSIAGYRIFRVITGSMEPEYDVGTVVICKEVPVNNIKVGDDIVYIGTYSDYNGKIIMHKVVAIDKDENNNNINFHAKGLHNSSVEDPQIKPNQIFGVVKYQSWILTKLYELATSIYSAFIIITILVLNVFVSFKIGGKDKVQKLEEHYDEIDEAECIEEDVEEDVEIEDENEEEIIEESDESDEG